MPWVIDASVALKLFLQEPESEQVARLWQRAEGWIAPDLLIAETGNALWKALRRSEIRPEQAARAMMRLPLLFHTLFPSAPLGPRALEISHTLDHPFYDCLYLALAEREQGVLITADERLAARVAGTPLGQLCTTAGPGRPRPMNRGATIPPCTRTVFFFAASCPLWPCCVCWCSPAAAKNRQARN